MFYPSWSGASNHNVCAPERGLSRLNTYILAARLLCHPRKLIDPFIFFRNFPEPEAFDPMNAPTVGAPHTRGFDDA